MFLKIEQEDSPTTQDKDVEQKWTVSLEMNPPKLGLIKNKLSINNQQIDANFWAESPETKNLIQRHLSLFKEQLTRANLQPERIQVSNGPDPVIQPVKPSTSILSEKA
ncbi:MAG: flagellar hook-length control protein FliK [Cycloclasticus sp.]|nr:flagellar hook-length control protein FliK [Cycloclasticus sp.]